MKLNLFPSKRIMIVDQQKKRLGRVPLSVARTLVDTKRATVLRKRPTVIKLHTPAKTRSIPVNRPTNPLRNLINTACQFTGRPEVLSSLLFEVVDGRLHVSSASPEASFTGSIEQGHTHGNNSRSICVSALRIKKVLSCCDRRDTLHISDGGIQLGSIFIEGYSPEKFPKIAPPEGRITRSLNIPEITEKLQFAGKALSQKVYNTALRGIYIDLNGNCLAGSDGNRLHVVSIQEQGRNLNGSNNADNGIILPASVLKAAKLHTGAVNIITSKNPKHAQQAAQFPLTVPGCVDCSSVYRAINGNYPQYHEAIPKGFSSTFRVNKQELAQVLHRGLISYATDADSKPIIAHFKSGMLTVEVRTHGRIAFRGKVSGNYSGRPYHGSVDCRYLLDALTTMPGESVDILLQGNPNEAWTLKDDRGYMAVIMPIVSASSVK